MITLLTIFALPVATIILAIVLEKILRCPVLTALTFFAVYLIVTFAVFDASFLVFTIIYTILAFLTAIIAEIFFRKNCSSNQNFSDTIAVNVRNVQNGNRESCCCRRR